MKKLYILLSIFFLAQTADLRAQKDSTHFVFTIQTDGGVVGYANKTNDSSYYLNIDTNYTYNYDVDWDNDGIFEDTAITDSIRHEYQSPGTYTIRIKGSFPSIKLGIKFGLVDGDFAKLLSIDQWGTMQWENLDNAFAVCSNMSIKATDVPDLSNVTSLDGTFWQTHMNDSLDHWDVSNITSMNSTFRYAYYFNQDLNSWNVSNVTDMSVMFADAGSFNGNIENWDVSSVENMDYMFSFYTSWFITPPIDSSSFNQDLSNWDVSSVKNMDGMFWGALSFNQNISSWDVSHVNNMRNMFNNAVAFNQDIGDWDVRSVKHINGMFEGAKKFDQNLSDWDLDSINMDTSWNTDGFRGFFDSSAMSVENYDSTLISWERKITQDSLSFGARGLQFCKADSARNRLIKRGWVFTGDTLNCGLVGIRKPPDKAILRIYPNPTKGNITIDLDSEDVKHLMIYDANARLVKEVSLTNGTNQIDLSEYPNGLYFIRIGNQSEKIMLLH